MNTSESYCNHHLYILRHAKSAWDTGAPSDFQRPLNKRGQTDAPFMGEWIRSQGMRPQCLLSSPALRAWQTVTAVCTALALPEQSVLFDGQLYLADTDTLLSVLSHCPAEAREVLLVGHNPGLEELILHLAKHAHEIEDDKLLPTAALAHLTVPGWKQLKKSAGRLVRIVKPKQLKGAISE